MIGGQSLYIVQGSLVNINFAETPSLAIAKLYGSKESRIRVTYSLLNETHNLCLDKKDLIVGQLKACEKLLMYSDENDNRIALEQEIRELKMALDLMT
jgi:hypothetical protein